MFPIASRRPSGLTAALTVVLATPDDADQGRAAQQRPQQVAARPLRSVERDALAGQQQRAVELVVEQGARAEPLRVGGRRLVARAPTLLERDEPGDGRQREQAEHADQRGPQAALRARCSRAALLDERALALVQLLIVRGRPVERRCEPRTAVELAGSRPR